MLTRREMIKLGVMSAPALWYSRSTRANIWSDASDMVLSPQFAPFQVDLVIPPMVTPSSNPFTVNEMMQQTMAELNARGGSMSTAFEEYLRQNADFFEIGIKVGFQQVLPNGPMTKIWGYSRSGEPATWPGPTLMFKRGRPAVVRFVHDPVNHVPTATVIHYHGGHTTADYDGYPTDCFGSPSASASRCSTSPSRMYCYPNSGTRGATLLYHDHIRDLTGRNVYMGLAAFLILEPAVKTTLCTGTMITDSDEMDALRKVPQGTIDPITGLGKFDVPLILHDRVFDPQNQLVYNPLEFDGVLGDTFFVNGRLQPKFSVEPRKYRLRVLNGSNARVYQLAFSESPTQALNRLPFVQIGSDGGLLPKAVARDSFLIGMAERFEVIFDFKAFANNSVYLVNYLQQTEGTGPDDLTPRAGTPLMRFDVKPTASSEPDPPAIQHLETLLELRDDPSRFIEEKISPQGIRREFLFENDQGGWAINGQFFKPNIPVLDGNGKPTMPQLDSVEIWDLINDGGGWVHPVHIHLEQWQMLARNGAPPPLWEQGLKDTFYLGPDDAVRVFTKFRRQYPCWMEDNVGHYVFHCHNLEHEDMEMMGDMQMVP